MTPSNTAQTGPARIVSFSADAGARNFTLGQEGSKIEFRLRTPITGRNGIPLAVKSSDEISTLEKSHVVATYKKGVERLYVNGKQQAEVLNLTRDGIIAFGTRRTPVTAAAYSFFYFFPVSFLSVTFLLAHAKILMAVLSSVVIGAGLAVLTETFPDLGLFEEHRYLAFILWSCYARHGSGKRPDLSYRRASVVFGLGRLRMNRMLQDESSKLRASVFLTALLVWERLY